MPAANRSRIPEWPDTPSLMSRHRRIRVKIALKQSIRFPYFLERGIDTTILWVGGYARNRYMNAQTLYVSQGSA
jgi:hypothetical protein